MKNALIILFFIVLFIGVIFTALTNMGGPSEPLKLAVQDYLSEALNGKATVGTLHDMQFFPVAKIHVSDVKVTREGNPDPVFTLKEAQVATGFWDVAFTSGELRVLNVKDLFARSGVITEKELYFSRLGIVDEKVTEPPYLYAKGKYGGEPFTARVEMERKGSESDPEYKLGEDKPVTIESASLKLSAVVSQEGARKMRIKELKAVLDDKEIAGGNILVQSSSGRDNFYIEGELSLSDGSLLRPDLKITLDTEPTEISGTIAADQFSDQAVGLLLSLHDAIDQIIGSDTDTPGFDFHSPRLDLELDIKDFMNDGEAIGTLKSQLTMNDGVLDLGPVDGNLKDSSLHGELRLQSPKARFEDLSGDLSIILGKGAYKLSGIGLWGGGLVNAIMPDLNPDEDLSTINCGIANIKVEKGIAEVQTLFFDTARVTLVGKGSYDIEKDELNLTFKPEAKDIAIGTINSAVTVTGPIDEPSISPSLMDLGSKIGGLLLGAVNPAFFAFSLTDLGLTENHPCAEYIEAPAEKAEDTNSQPQEESTE